MSVGTLDERRVLIPPTAMLEQMKGRIHNIAQDMHVLNRSCGEELVRFLPGAGAEGAELKGRG